MIAFDDDTRKELEIKYREYFQVDKLEAEIKRLKGELQVSNSETELAKLKYNNMINERDEIHRILMKERQQKDEKMVKMPKTTTFTQEQRFQPLEDKLVDL